MKIKNITRHILIQVAIVALIAVGFAHADSVDCLPDCQHCAATIVVAPCCADMAEHGSGEMPHAAGDRKSTPDFCSFGSFCHGSTESKEHIAGNLLPNIEGLEPPSSQDLLVVINLKSLYSPALNYEPFPHKSHPLYTLNCSFLI